MFAVPPERDVFELIHRVRFEDDRDLINSLRAAKIVAVEVRVA